MRSRSARSTADESTASSSASSSLSIQVDASSFPWLPTAASLPVLRPLTARPALPVPGQPYGFGQDDGMTSPDRTGPVGTAAAALAVIPPVSTADFADPDWIAPFAREAERLGFESLVLPEH